SRRRLPDVQSDADCRRRSDRARSGRGRETALERERGAERRMSASHAHGNSAHDHGHGHHAPAPGGHERALRSAFFVIALFMLVEGGVGLVANSVTVIADAGHMLLDASALGFSWYAVRLSERESSERLSYGYHRFQVLAAFVNGLALIALCIGIVIAALAR